MIVVHEGWMGMGGGVGFGDYNDLNFGQYIDKLLKEEDNGLSPPINPIF